MSTNALCERINRLVHVLTRKKSSSPRGSQMITVRVPRKLHSAILEAARREKTSMNLWCTAVLLDAVREVVLEQDVQEPGTSEHDADKCPAQNSPPVNTPPSPPPLLPFAPPKSEPSLHSVKKPRWRFAKVIPLKDEPSSK